MTCLRIYSADDGLTKNSSKSTNLQTTKVLGRSKSPDFSDSDSYDDQNDSLESSRFLKKIRNYLEKKPDDEKYFTNQGLKKEFGYEVNDKLKFWIQKGVIRNQNDSRRKNMIGRNHCR